MKLCVVNVLCMCCKVPAGQTMQGIHYITPSLLLLIWSALHNHSTV